VVWGPEEDTVTAANEVRLRYADATSGVPNETRQPFLDGSTDFERILPGPDRMYPDTDSPPTPVTRERVERLRAPLPPRPWEREARYSAAGVPTGTIHFLIRRGAARLVDDVVERAGADLRTACFFFGERLKGLGRRGVAVGSVGAGRWRELFALANERPVLWEAWTRLVRAIAADPALSVDDIVRREGLGAEPPAWQESLGPAITAAVRDAKGNGDRARRLVMGRLMEQLRGSVPASRVSGAVEAELGRHEGLRIGVAREQ
jgi:glutamyl-tRNA(Gln) amidotransferase subunit E